MVAAAADGKAQYGGQVSLPYPHEEKAGIAPLGRTLLRQLQQQHQTQHPVTQQEEEQQQQQQPRQQARRQLQEEATRTAKADAGSEAVAGAGREEGRAVDRRQAAVNSTASRAATADAGSVAAANHPDGGGAGGRDASSSSPSPQPAPSSVPVRQPASPPNPPPPPPPPLELAAMPDPQLPVSERCVFILGTGRSGSTSLADALNQLPNYLIRGEQEGGFWFLYLAWRALQRAGQHSTEFRSLQRKAEARFGERNASRLTYDTVKQLYDTYAVQTKMPWFNDLQRARLNDVARAFYAGTYGYHGPGIVSGFKEIRFVCGRAFPSPGCRYSDFDNFLRFLRQLCTDVKLLLNSRSSSSAADNAKLGTMLSRRGVLNDTSRFEKDMATTHEWYDRYVKEHGSSAFRVVMEHMFDPQRNATLARRLLQFLGEDPDAHSISFNRMPTWSDPSGGGIDKKAKKAKHQHREPWQIRRRRRRALAEAAEAGAEAGAGAGAAVNGRNTAK